MSDGRSERSGRCTARTWALFDSPLGTLTDGMEGAVALRSSAGRALEIEL